jgi:hypothetical protein
MWNVCAEYANRSPVGYVIVYQIVKSICLLRLNECYMVT